MRSVSPYQIRFKRRPILYWWQTGALLGFVALLFLEIPFVSITRQAFSITPPLPDPTVAYVTLDPDYAAQLFKRSLSAWMTGRAKKQTSGLDLSALDFDNGLGVPDFLEQSGVLPSDRQPLDIAALPATFAEISIQPVTPVANAARYRKPQEGLFIEMSPTLVAAKFTFPSNELKAMKERSGECRFYVETDTEGNAAHVLLRSKPSPDTFPIERALMRGRAQGAVNGTVDIRWCYTQ